MGSTDQSLQLDRRGVAQEQWYDNASSFPMSIMEPKGIEPLAITYCSNLNGVGGIRTLILLIAKQALYHWSYYPVIRNCDKCGNSYNAKPAELKRGNGRFCSRSCSNSRPRVVRIPNSACAYCGKEFWRRPSLVKKTNQAFCNRLHKDLAARKPSNYRLAAFSHYTIECADCGWKECPDILVVHHKDENRANNDLSNLVILCPTHHDLRHFRAKTAKWATKQACFR